MAYNNYLLPNYQYQQQTPVVYQPQYPQQQQQQQTQQMQSGGFMSVRSEQEARNYPVAPGNVMTFKIEGQPYVCEKAQGFSQLDGPVFRKYRLVEEVAEEQVVEEPQADVWEELKALRAELDELKTKLPKPTNRKTKEIKEDE